MFATPGDLARPTPSEMLVERTIALVEDQETRHVPILVTGDYPDEPAGIDGKEGKLPLVVIPMVITYENGQYASRDMVMTAARVLAARLYGTTRHGVLHTGINARLAPVASMLHGCFQARCPRTHVPFIVYEPSHDLGAAQQHVASVYRSTSDEMFFAGIGADMAVIDTVRPVHAKLF